MEKKHRRQDEKVKHNEMTIRRHPPIWKKVQFAFTNSLVFFNIFNNSNSLLRVEMVTAFLCPKIFICTTSFNHSSKYYSHFYPLENQALEVKQLVNGHIGNK